jgi:hypothetical protein
VKPVVVYTSLGFGDIQPIAHVRLIAGVEALVGLLMIGWSASFTYISMERFWLFFLVSLRPRDDPAMSAVPCLLPICGCHPL